MIINDTQILAVASDFDGTIIREGMTEPPARFYDMVTMLLDAGIPFIAASGRQYGNLRRLLGPHANNVSYISENGCLVVHDDKVIHKSVFDRELAMELIADMQSHPEGEIMVSGENTSYLVTNNTEYINMLKLSGIGYAVSSAMPHIRAQADFVCETVEDVIFNAINTQ